MAVTPSFIENEIRKRCNNIPDVISIILMGRCARGEETYFLNEHGEKELMSDYEVLIAVKSAEGTSDVDKALKQLQNELLSLSHSECFDLEWSYKTIAEIERLDKRFIFFETKEAKKVITGDKDIFTHFPDINISNLNYSELNTIILHRMYHVIRDMNSGDEKYKKYVIARNSLDFASAFLPLTGRLVSSYSERMKALKKISLEYGVPQDLINRHNDYLTMKLDYNSNLYHHYSLDSMYEYFYHDVVLLDELQRKFQHGKRFRTDYRRIISAIYRMDLHNLYNSLLLGRKLNRLFEEMLSIIKVREINKNRLADIQGKMKDLFGYC